MRRVVDTVINHHKQNPKMLLVYAILLYAFAQTLAWLQINGQFVCQWCKDNPFPLSLMGIPISYMFIVATNLTFVALSGQAWPGRLLTFAVGIVIFTTLTYAVLGEAVTWKTAVSLFLTLVIIILQVF